MPGCLATETSASAFAGSAVPSKSLDITTRHAGKEKGKDKGKGKGDKGKGDKGKGEKGKSKGKEKGKDQNGQLE